MSNLPAYDFTINYVSNLEESLAFYLKLGFRDVPEEGGPGFHQLRGKEGSHDFGIVQASAETPPAGVVRTYFKVADLNKAREDVLSKGIEAGPIVEMPFGTIFQVKSPDGNTVTLMAG